MPSRRTPALGVKVVADVPLVMPAVKTLSMATACGLPAMSVNGVPLVAMGPLRASCRRTSSEAIWPRVTCSCGL